jgi:hypothetical protein
VRRIRYLLAVAIVASAALAASGCGGDAPGVRIGPEVRAGNAKYTLLYSTLGYEGAATKHLLIRQNDTEARPSEALAFGWQLVDAKGQRRASGRASYAGTAFGVPLWLADFSRVTQAGTYRIVVDAPDAHLATEPFRIDTFLAFQTTFSGLAFDSGDARSTPIELDYGFHDGNGGTGGVPATSDYLVGIAESYARRRAVLSDQQRTHMKQLISRAADYLLVASDAGTGKFQFESATRPYNNDEPSNTAAGLRGLARFASAMHSEEPEKAERVYRRARLAEEWLLANAPELYPPALRAAVDYDFYRYAGDPSMLDAATKAVRQEAQSYDLRTMDRSSFDTLPHFEAMFRMWRDIPTAEDRGFWLETAREAARQYHEMLDKNVFEIVAPGVADAARGATPAAQWDNVATDAPPGEGDGGSVGNGWIIARAIDAVYLAQMTKDATLEPAATASLAWIGGLNAGVRADRVTGEAGGPLAAASLLTGAGVRSALPWSQWWWVRPRPFAAVLGGFQTGLAFYDSPQSGGTSLGRDGQWLYATAAYEDFLNAGKQAPAPAPAPAPAAGVHVVSTQKAETGGLLQFIVTVAGPDGKAAPGVRVLGAWSGAPLPGHFPHEATQVTECATDASGSCVLVLDASSLPVSRPIAVAVTALEHARYGYDITSDSPQKSADFE